ncbi:MAG: hypothetical protein ACYC0H_19890 [Solirubrobacteraceae bacterium]
MTSRHQHRRSVLGLVACAGCLALAPVALAQSTVVVSVSAAGSAVVVEVSGAADPCPYCTSQDVEVEADPIQPGSLLSCWPSSPQAAFPVSTAGGSFSFSTTIPVATGQEYEVCGFVVQTDSGLATSLPVAESLPTFVAVSPTACPPGTQQALSLQAPRSVPIGLRGIVTVQPKFPSDQSVSTAALTMQGLPATSPFYSHVFTAGDLKQISDYNSVRFFIEFSRGDGPAQITLSYTQTVSGASRQECVVQASAIVRPATAPTPQVSMYSGARPSQALARRPRLISYSGDGAAFLAGRRSTRDALRWKTWGASVGRAQGDDWHDNRIPDCARGTYFGYPASIRAYRPRKVDGYLVFTRITVTYTRARPPYPAYRHRSVTYKLRYDAQYNAFLWI